MRLTETATIDFDQTGEVDSSASDPFALGFVRVADRIDGAELVAQVQLSCIEDFLVRAAPRIAVLRRDDADCSVRAPLCLVEAARQSVRHNLARFADVARSLLHDVETISDGLPELRRERRTRPYRALVAGLLDLPSMVAQRPSRDYAPRESPRLIRFPAEWFEISDNLQGQLCLGHQRNRVLALI